MFGYYLLQCIVCGPVIFSVFSWTWLKMSTLPSDYNKHSEWPRTTHGLVGWFGRCLTNHYVGVLWTSPLELLCSQTWVELVGLHTMQCAGMVRSTLSGHGLFQEDSSPIHWAYGLNELFDEWCKNVHYTAWPSHSTDLSATKHLWYIMSNVLGHSTIS